MIVGESKPPLGELAHFGVKGMRWGHHKPTTSAGTSSRMGPKSGAATTRFDRVVAAQDKVSSAKTVSAHNKALDELAAVQRQNKAEVAAEKQTRRDNRNASVKNAVNATGDALAKTGQAASKVVTYAVHHRRAIAGGLIAAHILLSIGASAVSGGNAAIFMKAARNREAARKGAEIASRMISSTASKVNYAKMAKGAYNITTMK